MYLSTWLLFLSHGCQLDNTVQWLSHFLQLLLENFFTEILWKICDHSGRLFHCEDRFNKCLNNSIS